ncbi:MAG: hypothetical protein JOZ62_08860 [Acidobacteriaceae bacterium]|nr:hypothetical protein [Acidobacteriaceae bacterium]
MSAPFSATKPSERRLAANRANAQLSTGPQTPEGKAKSSLNAVKTGLTGRTVLLPSEDAEAYETHLLQYLERFAPVGERETELVQNLADTQWRLHRIPNLEAGLFALGRLRYADLFAAEPNPQIRAAMLDAHILMTEAKHFKNLHLQESRLRRQYRQDAQELQECQKQRKQEQEKQEQPKEATPLKALAATGGFEFATAEQSRDRNGSDRPASTSSDASVQTQASVG